MGLDCNATMECARQCATNRSSKRVSWFMSSVVITSRPCIAALQLPKYGGSCEMSRIACSKVRGRFGKNARLRRDPSSFAMQMPVREPGTSASTCWQSFRTPSRNIWSVIVLRAALPQSITDKIRLVDNSFVGAEPGGPVFRRRAKAAKKLTQTVAAGPGERSISQKSVAASFCLILRSMSSWAGPGGSLLACLRSFAVSWASRSSSEWVCLKRRRLMTIAVVHPSEKGGRASARSSPEVVSVNRTDPKATTKDNPRKRCFQPTRLAQEPLVEQSAQMLPFSFRQAH